MARIDLRDPSNWVPRDVFAAYCGPNQPKLLEYYDKATAKRNQLVLSFDPLAFFLMPGWLGYRRQWTLWAVLAGLITLLPFLEAALGFQFPTSAFMGTTIALGLMARGFLLSNATAIYRKLAARGLEPAAIQNAMTDRARPSMPLLFVGLVAFIAITALGVIVAEMLFGSHLPAEL